MSKPTLKLVEAPVPGGIELDQSFAIPDGLYRLAFHRYQVVSRFNRGSLELWFRVMNFGPHFEKLLCRYYKVSRAGKRSFKASRHSAFVREFIAVFGKRPPAGVRAAEWFRQDVYVEGLVGTVTKGYDQKAIPEGARYSVIRELQRRIEP